MTKHALNRRSFMGVTAAGLAVLSRASWVRAAGVTETRDPDLIVVNATLYTVDAR